MFSGVIIYFFVGFALQAEAKEYAPYDGWYNNRGNPSAGSYDSVLTRRVSPSYEDGVYAPSGSRRPNPRTISSNIFSGTSGIPSAEGKTALFYFFGEHLLQEISGEQAPGCPPEYFNIPIPVGDPTFDFQGSGTVSIPYQRADYETSNSGYSPNHPREQLNPVTSYLDGSSIYGRDKTWSDQLRLFQTTCNSRTLNNIFADSSQITSCSGELTSFADEGKVPLLNSKGLPLNNPVPPFYRSPLSATRFHQTGGRDLNENPYLMTIAVIWFRHHNWWARQMRQTNPDWTDERVFNEARTRNIATYQNVVLNEWLPALLGSCSSNSNEVCGEIPAYNESQYQSGTSVRISDLFQVAAKHYIRTLAPQGVFTRTRYNTSTGCQFSGPSRICNEYWRTNEIINQTPIDEIIMGMASQIAEQDDYIINEDLRNSFHGPLHFSRRDLIALIVQQGRDYGLPDYNTVREELGLSRRNSFEEINPELFQGNNSQLLELINSIHGGNIDDMDVFVGGMLETRNNQPGELFRLIIIDQFRRLRDGDRFWFENERNGLLNQTEISEMKSVTFRDVILRTNPSLDQATDIQDFPFFWNKSGDTKLFCPQPYQIGAPTFVWNERCSNLSTYDYFSTSRVSFAVVFAVIGLFVLLTILLMYGLAKCRQKQIANNRKKLRIHRSSVANQGTSATIATELLGNQNNQQVQINLNSDKSISVKAGRGNKIIRKINLDASDMVEVLTSKTSNIVLFRSTKATYDLILQFSDEEGFEGFSSKVKDFLKSGNVEWITEDLGSESSLMDKAQTKEKRDKVLQKFFKSALAHSLKIEVDEEDNQRTRRQSKMLINTKISKEEFADYLKLKSESSFVQQMFSVADGDDDGLVSFREFLDIVVLFTKGSPQDKMKLMFNMYDTDQTGTLSADEFKAMLKSMMEMVSVTINVEQLDQLVTDLMRSSGIDGKESLKLRDFMNIMSTYSGEMSEARLVVSGLKDSAPVKKNTDSSKAALSKNNPARKEPAKSVPMQQNGIYKPKNSLSPESYERKFDQRRQTRLSRARMTINRHMKTNEQPEFPNRRHTRVVTDVPVFQEKYSKNKYVKMWIVFTKWNQHYASHIFLVILYTCITIGVFLQSHNVVASNHPSGLSRIGGGWPAIARASAAALMFNFSTLLLTMSRNTITLLRETFLHRYIPFDGAIAMHKFIAWMALLFTTLHVVAHGINFYSISTQTPSDLLCLFRDYWFPTDYLPNFVFWCFQTITGITGVLLTLDVILMYVFASNYSRRAIFNWFQGTHKFGYMFLYFFCVLHGSGTLISSPRFYLYFLGPAVLYTLDKLYSLSRKKIQISVVNAELLPSDVTHLEFKRPSNFNYKAGQWVRIACLAQSPAEYHPFTLSSAPHEKTLKLHIRAVGPWTQNLRKIYNPETLQDAPYPKLYLDGPFGEGHQDWYKYEVSVLVGGGIGVTPFASILKDLVNTTQSGADVTCKAVYFIWVTRDQKQYEWLTDIIQEVENKDVKGVLNTHIFITQFPQKFDLRTTMLYICEQHFQKIAGKSLFTGLRAVTHFGRPNFIHFLASLADEHNKVDNFGVFSCGPPQMTNSVEKACSKLNKYEGASYSHHFENF